LLFLKFGNSFIDISDCGWDNNFDFIEHSFNLNVESKFIRRGGCCNRGISLLGFVVGLFSSLSLEFILILLGGDQGKFFLLPFVRFEDFLNIFRVVGGDSFALGFFNLGSGNLLSFEIINEFFTEFDISLEWVGSAFLNDLFVLLFSLFSLFFSLEEFFMVLKFVNSSFDPLGISDQFLFIFVFVLILSEFVS
jgi:hypothetical protein